MDFHHISLGAFCHATEDVELVKEAMLKLSPFEKAEFKQERTEGSFGNPITILKLDFEKQSDIRGVVDFIKSRLEGDIDVDAHVSEDGDFWIRFDKQEAFKGNIVLGVEDAIQLKGKVAAFPANRENAVEIMEKVWK